MSLLKKICLILSVVLVSIFVSVSFAADVAAGKEKAMLCSGCHGEDGTSVSPEIPNLAGQKEAYLMKALKDFRAENRRNPMMNSVAQVLSDDDIVNLAAYFSSL